MSATRSTTVLAVAWCSCLVVTAATQQLRAAAVRKLVFAVLGAAMLASAGGLAWLALQPSSQQTSQAEGHYPLIRRVQYSFTVRNKTNRLVERSEFWTYAPVSKTSLQRCESITASHAYRLHKDDYGNQVLHFELKDLAPYETRVLRIRAKLRMAERANRLPLTEHEFFLAPTRFMELGEPEIQRVAHTLRHADQEAAARRAFEWVVRNLAHEGYVERDRGALHALRSRRGDCTEFSYLYGALCRVNSVPARVMGGYLHRNDGILRPADYHNWVEIYVDGAWRVVDPQKGIFMERESEYIPMTIITGDKTGPLAGAHRFVHSGGNLQVTMN